MKHWASIILMGWFAWHPRAQVVNVTAHFDSATAVVGGVSTLRVFAQVEEGARSESDQILTWHVDLLNLTPGLGRLDFSTLRKSASDNDPRTSSIGNVEGANNLRGIFDTFLNAPAAGIFQPVELLSCQVTFLSVGKVIIEVAPGATVTNLASDFLVNPIAELPPFTGGIYTKSRAEVTVSAGGVNPGPVRLRIAHFDLPGSLAHRAELSFNGVTGPRYVLEYADALLPQTGWSALPGAPHNAGFFSDTNSVPSRFYRVRIDP